MLTKEEIEKIAKQKYPAHMGDDGWKDENEAKRHAFIEGVVFGLSVGERY